MPRSNYKLFQSSEMEEDLLNVENSDHMEEESQSSENSSDISEVQSVEINRDINMDYGEEISDNNGYEVLEGTETVSEFERLLISQEDEMADEARKLWNYTRNNFSTHDLCNKCGNFLNRNENCSRCEGSAIATFVRIGGFFQILDLVETFLADILSIRRELKSGKDIPHSLNSHFFSEYWKKEADDHLNLSTVLSIDGVHISGTTKKLWPVSLILVDLPTGLMQKSTSVVLEGLVECSETPSTAVWNSIIPFIVSDIERNIGKIGGFTIKCYIATVTADQPVWFLFCKRILCFFTFQAKRAFIELSRNMMESNVEHCREEELYSLWKLLKEYHVILIRILILFSSKLTELFFIIKHFIVVSCSC
ncbi:hypothetical protein CRE_19596 [Caenorhabditis remanei]|uniref:Uncharacterized protein n=1 Tax=Caenorhabditis remanei TaxID=31234 RepID=E3NS39_CAERE|nr:hypothetical protein CRE_19596 [Caenorhabditis remanei]